MLRLTSCAVRSLNSEQIRKSLIFSQFAQKCLITPIVDNRSMRTSAVLNKEVEKTAIEMPEYNFVQKMYKKFFRGIPNSKLKASGYILLTHCVQLQNLEKFFRVFDMPDTFNSWFLVTELHIWMLSARLMTEGEYGRTTRNAIIEALWQDCDQRAKSISDLPSSIRTKQILDISEQFQAALFVYDEGLVGGDKELANALWRRFFLSQRESEEKQVPDMEKVALLVDYIRRTMQHLDNTDAVELIIQARVNWLDLHESIKDL